MSEFREYLTEATKSVKSFSTGKSYEWKDILKMYKRIKKDSNAYDDLKQTLKDLYDVDFYDVEEIEKVFKQRVEGAKDIWDVLWTYERELTK